MYRTATGLAILLLALGILWSLAKYGPDGADWIGDRTRKVFGLTIDVEGSPESIDTVETRAMEEEKKGNDASPSSTRGGNEDPRVRGARNQISRALGEGFSVEHVAFSRDDSAMVAALRLTDSGEILEIYFEMDEFGRYVSVPDSPVDKEIKIWKEQ